METGSGNVAKEFLAETIAVFASQKDLADKAMSQLEDRQLFWTPDEESNSIAIIVQHMSGNMVSRWTDFLHSDGEKATRNRDAEFIGRSVTRGELTEIWERGWQTLFLTLSELDETDLLRTVYIRHEPHSVIKAIHRQISHYGYHVGQIVYIAKLAKSSDWQTLSIPKKRI